MLTHTKRATSSLSSRPVVSCLAHSPHQVAQEHFHHNSRAHQQLHQLHCHCQPEKHSPQGRQGCCLLQAHFGQPAQACQLLRFLRLPLECVPLPLSWSCCRGGRADLASLDGPPLCAIVQMLATSDSVQGITITAVNTNSKEVKFCRICFPTRSKHFEPTMTESTSARCSRG